MSKTKEPQEHHIWCNYFMRPRKGCQMCEELFTKYPPKPNMLKKYFPSVVKIPNTEDAK